METKLLILTSLGLIIGVKFLLFLKQFWRKWRIFRTIPGPPFPPLPLIGHTVILRGDPDEMYENIVRWAFEYVTSRGHEIGHIWFGPVPLISVFGPNAAEELLRSSHHLDKAFTYKFIHPWLGITVLTATSEKWKQRRKLLTPTFHFSILQDFLEVMNEQSAVFVSKLEKRAQSGEPFNISAPITLCALDIICETAMGKAIHSQDNEETDYVKAIYRSTELVQDRQKSPWLWPDNIYKYTKRGRDFARCLSILHGFTNSVIRERMKTFEPNISWMNTRRMAFLDLLLNLSENGKVLSFQDMREEVDTFMFEGHDTTAAALGWALHLIGCHPHVQQRIQEELDEVLGEKQKLSMEDVRNLHYLEMVIKESLRILPSVPIIGRVTSVDCKLDGHFIPAGTECFIYPHIINKNENFWPDPNRYDPERFHPDNCLNRHPYCYLPFSAGPRNCIGQKFAVMEEKVVLAHFLREYSVESCDKTEELKLNADIIMRSKNGINVKISKRRPY